jgi:hypothetical protein
MELNNLVREYQFRDRIHFSLGKRIVFHQKVGIG